METWHMIILGKKLEFNITSPIFNPICQKRKKIWKVQIGKTTQYMKRLERDPSLEFIQTQHALELRRDLWYVRSGEENGLRKRVQVSLKSMLTDSTISRVRLNNLQRLNQHHIRKDHFFVFLFSYLLVRGLVKRSDFIYEMSQSGSYCS